MVLEKTLEGPLDFKELQPVNSKGNQSCAFIGTTDVKAEAHYFGHLMQRTDSLEKTLILGKIEGRRGSGQQKMRWLDGITNLMDNEFEQVPGVGDGLGSLACCGPWGHKESDKTWRLN